VITQECLFCHANRVEYPPKVAGNSQMPKFEGHSIGCERCHGPGELHSKQPLPTAEGRKTIINPVDLPPSLRDNVCEQCHLKGDKVVIRPGRELADYRPGLPLHLFETVFVRPPGEADDLQIVGHVEQMHKSRCFIASQGAMGCTSCHDPHSLPAPEKKTTYYRNRCLDCHAEKPCSLPRPVRLEQNPADDCMACHMPRAKSNIPHVASTDHSIRRQLKGSSSAESTDSQIPRSDPLSLVPFHADQMSPEDRRNASRDLGVALSARGKRGATKSLSLLQEALKLDPDDISAREALGQALGAIGRFPESLQAYEEILSRDPENVSALMQAAVLADGLKRRSESIAYLRRAVALDPRRSNPHAALALQLSKEKLWEEAVSECGLALKLNPSNISARMTLIQCYARSGKLEQARSEFRVLQELNPDKRGELSRWFDSVK
jgi:predicted CXXCH cytochrome family protein